MATTVPRRMRRAGIIGVAAAGAGILAGLVRRYAIADRSMSPALQPGDWVIAIRTRPAAVGDIVVVEHPARPGFELVKRVIALPGSEVEIADFAVHVDGAPEAWAPLATPGFGRWRVPEGHVFVLGDARGLSIDDSRTLGPLPIPYRPWRVMWRYHPAFGPV